MLLYVSFASTRYDLLFPESGSTTVFSPYSICLPSAGFQLLLFPSCYGFIGWKKPCIRVLLESMVFDLLMPLL